MARAKRTPAQNAAIYARRQARSQAIYGAGYGAKKGARTRRKLNRILPTDVTAAPKPISVSAGGRNITKTVGARSGRNIRAALEAAAARGQTVDIQVTFTNAAGQPRTRNINRVGRTSGGGAGSGGGGGGAGGGGGGRGSSHVPLGPVQITAGTGPGVSARQLLQWIDSYYDGDIFDALYDWWEELYG